MKFRLLCSAVLLSGLLASTASAAFTGYIQNFEGLNPADPAALADDGWLVGANVFDPTGTTFLYNYFAFPAPNGGPAFSGIATGEGGAPQGNNQLSVYNDYNNADHNVGNQIEAIVFQEWVLDASDVGKTLTMSFDAKLGNLVAPTTAEAFLQILDPGAGFNVTAIYEEPTQGLPTTWGGFSGSIVVPAGSAGDILQLGFRSTTSNYTASGVFYDNIVVTVPEPGSLAALAIGSTVMVLRRRRRR